MKKFIRIITLVACGASAGLLGYGGGSRHAVESGYIRCVDGHWEIGNLEVSGKNKNGDFIVTLNSECDVAQ